MNFREKEHLNENTLDVESYLWSISMLIIIIGITLDYIIEKLEYYKKDDHRGRIHENKLQQLHSHQHSGVRLDKMCTVRHHGETVIILKTRINPSSISRGQCPNKSKE